MLLAAGESRRMGAFKQLLKLGGKSFVERCVRALLHSHVREVIVVTGYRAADVSAELRGLPVRIEENPNYALGMTSSIKCGVCAIGPNVGGCLIALADQPLITTDTVDRLIQVFEDERPLIVVPTFGGKGGHPVILDMSLKKEILAMDPDRGLRQVTAANAARTLRVELNTSSVLTDFDRPEDYLAFKDAL